MQKFIKTSLDYIEQNLKTEITADELAVKANYSIGHFCRLFAQAMDSTVANYILQKRLDHAIVEISSGRKAIGVVLEYGFDTYAGFYKAFVKMYGCSPKKYQSIYKKTEVLTMRSKKDIRTILENWDIPKGLKIENVSAKDWKTGKITWETWQIGDDYYLKTNERSKMIRNIKIAKALIKEGLTSEFLPINTLTGDDYLDGENIFIITKKVGEPLNSRPLSDDEIMFMENNENREKYAFKLGQGIARLHRALKTIQEDVNPYEANLYNQGLKSIPRVKEFSLKYSLGIEDAFFDDYKTFGQLYEKLPKQLIHGNPTGDSVIYENGEVVGLKGYEIYNISHVRLFDVIYCAGEIQILQIESYLKMLKDILNGYDSLIPLTLEEKQSIYYVLCAIAMNCIEYCGDTLDISSRNLRALSFLAKNKELFSNMICTK